MLTYSIQDHEQSLIDAINRLGDMSDAGSGKVYFAITFAFVHIHSPSYHIHHFRTVHNTQPTNPMNFEYCVTEFVNALSVFMFFSSYSTSLDTLSCLAAFITDEGGHRFSHGQSMDRE